MMNIHHLELFYYVARHGGIHAAVRNIPYGIQQPAVSGQIIQLEEYLGLVLFHRQPFSLTPQGLELYEFIRPFFENLESMSDKLRGGKTRVFRVAASTVVLRHHIPELLQSLLKKHPHVRLVLREGLQPEMEDWLRREEIDLAVTVLEGRPGPGIKSQMMIQLPLCLLVPRGLRLKHPEDLWQKGRVQDTLVSLPQEEAITKHFRDTLSVRGIDWPMGIEVTSLDLIETYVARGFGIGLAVEVPGVRRPREIRSIPLEGFAPINVGALWRGKMDKVTQDFLAALQMRANELIAMQNADTQPSPSGSASEPPPTPSASASV